jgi:hypothetical protein
VITVDPVVSVEVVKVPAVAPPANVPSSRPPLDVKVVPLLVKPGPTTGPAEITPGVPTIYAEMLSTSYVCDAADPEEMTAIQAVVAGRVPVALPNCHPLPE